MLNQNLQQKLLQKLSPQQIQLIKLLEIPTIQLEQRIKKEIEENPLLEDASEYDDANGEASYEDDDNDKDSDTSTSDSDDNDTDTEAEFEEREERTERDEDNEFSLDDYYEADDIPDYKLSANNYSKDDKRTEMPYSEGSSFHESLLNQVGLRDLNEREQEIASYIIGNIDDDGYLRREIESLVDDIAFAANINTNENELLQILTVIQDFDPPGVGARDLQECLLIQLRRKMNVSTTARKQLENAYDILKEYFNEFTKKHYDKIVDKLGISERNLKSAIDEILKLNPKPGSGFNEEATKTLIQIIPDFILDETNGELQLQLNSRNAPELRISRTYADMIEEYGGNKKKNSRGEKEAIAFVKQKLDAAKWFIDAIKQRQNTLMVTMNAIVEYQRSYFIEGDETLLRPMILKDIAERTNLDISTISRVANSKYIQTHFGIFPLKYFFSEGMQTETGEEVSTREIKKILQDCVDRESKRRPLTDERLAKILQEKGYHIARRTVAKYREQLNIPVARLRKQL